MSKKTNDTPASVRIRENQRRSRARRQELIKDLQDRVRHFELSGVAATKEVQQAARKVAQENVRLRDLLALHGISEDVVESHLRTFDDHVVPLDPAVAAVRSLAASNPACGHVGEQDLSPNHWTNSYDVRNELNNDNSHHQQIIDSQYNYEHDRAPSTQLPSFESSQDEPRHAAYCSTNSNTSEDHEGPQFQDEDLCPSTHQCFCPPTTPKKAVEPEHGLEISCETAAAIIADMRGDADRATIRVSLGCVSDEACNVKNTAVLQILDET